MRLLTTRDLADFFDFLHTIAELGENILVILPLNTFNRVVQELIIAATRIA